MTTREKLEELIAAERGIELDQRRLIPDVMDDMARLLADEIDALRTPGTRGEGGRGVNVDKPSAGWSDQRETLNLHRWWARGWRFWRDNELVFPWSAGS